MASSQSIPDEIPRFDIRQFTEVKRLGQGGFGSVTLYNYKEPDGATKRIAVKKLLDGQFLHKRKIQRLKQEARILWNLTCEFIIKLVGLVYSETEFSLVLEYAPNGSCFDLFRDLKAKNLSKTGQKKIWPLKIRFVEQVIDGMLFLHNKKPKRILHIDLKAANILLDSNYVAKICDFGLSHMETLTSLSSVYQAVEHQKKKDRVGGTTSHKAPEHLRNPNMRPNVKSDVYSFAIFVWELLTNEIPYSHAASEKALIIALRDESQFLRPDLQDVPVHAPHFLREIMIQCWDDAPSMRPSFQGLKRNYGHQLREKSFLADQAVKYLTSQKSCSIFTASIPNSSQIEISSMSTFTFDVQNCFPLREINHGSIMEQSNTEETPSDYPLLELSLDPNQNQQSSSHHTQQSVGRRSTSRSKLSSGYHSFLHEPTSVSTAISANEQYGRLMPSARKRESAFLSKRCRLIVLIGVPSVGIVIFFVIFMALFASYGASFCFLSNSCFTPSKSAPNCSTSPLVENGRLTCKALPKMNNSTTGVKCEVICEQGYSIYGKTNISCQLTDGLWSTLPICTKRNRQDFGKSTFCSVKTLNGGRLVCNGFDVNHVETGDVCQVTCNAQYKLQGLADRQCLADGTWSEAKGECIRECPYEPVPQQVISNNCTNGNLAGSECSYECGPGRIQTGPLTRSCLRNGQWDKPFPSCPCATCHYGNSCENQYLYSRLNKQMIKLRSDKSPVNLEYGDKTITCESDADIWFFNYDCSCRGPGGSEATCNDYMTRKEACRHAVSSLLRDASPHKLIPEPCDLASTDAAC